MRQRSRHAGISHPTLGVNLLVVGLLAALNLYRNPGNLSGLIWVLLGWGISVAAHGLAILLQRSGLRREEMFTDRRKRSFLVHLFAYVARERAVHRRQSSLFTGRSLVPLSADRLGRAACRPCLYRFLSWRAARPPGQEVKSMKKPRLWYVIADGGRARFVEPATRKEPSARCLASFPPSCTRARMSLGAIARRGSRRAHPPARSAVEPRRDPA